MPGGILCSTTAKGSLYLSWNNLLGKMTLSNVCRNLGSFVVIDVSCSNRGEAITGDLMIDSSYSF